MLIEAAKLAPGYSHDLALIRDRELQRGHRNRATLAVAMKIEAYMLAVERRKQDFLVIEQMAGFELTPRVYDNAFCRVITLGSPLWTP